MREILFRAKSMDTGKWLYGFYYQMTFGPNDELRHYLVLTPLGTGEDRIDPKTLGQFIGTNDKNGKKIFEGDIVLTNEAGWKAVVVYSDEAAMFMCENKGFSTFCEWEEFEVLGNIHDNPELLKGGEM